MMGQDGCNPRRMNASLGEKTQSVQAELRSIVSVCIANMGDDPKEAMSCQVTTEACLDSKELNPKDMESKLEHREAPTEEAAVKSSGTMKKRHRGQHLATGRRGEPKELTRGDCGSRRKLATVCTKISRCVAVARRKGNIFRKIRTQKNFGPRKELTAAGRKMTRCAGHRPKAKNKDDVASRNPKGRTFGMRRWKGPEYYNDIRARGLKQQLRGSKRIKDLGGRRPLYLRKKRTITDDIGGWSSRQQAPLGSEGKLKKTLHEISRSEIAKQMFETSIRMRNMRNWTLWRGRLPPKRKKNLLAAFSIRAGNVGTLATLRRLYVVPVL
jgi:hypothetical protein